MFQVKPRCVFGGRCSAQRCRPSASGTSSAQHGHGPSGVRIMSAAFFMPDVRIQSRHVRSYRNVSHPISRDGEPSHGQRTCPKCATDAIRTIAVPWYPELEYLSCATCHYVWTVARASTHVGSDVTHEGPQLPLICIVDDDNGVRAALDHLLRSAGFRTVLCDSAETVLACARVGGIALAELDAGRRPARTQDRHARRAAFLPTRAVARPEYAR
jgi:CheY-like chemotaxis protein